MWPRPTVVLTVGLLLIPILTIQASTEFQVSNNGSSSYRINEVNNPALTLQRGTTYIFHISTPGHPFWINTVRSTGTENSYSGGITGNGITQGDLQFTVPSNAPDQLFYNCQFHSPMTGTLTIEGTVGGIKDNDALPLTYGLYSIFPNPVNPAVTILYGLPGSVMVRLTIFDILGRQVAVLLDGLQPAGSHTLGWDGTDSAGRPVGSGVYLVRLESSGAAATRRVLLLK